MNKFFAIFSTAIAAIIISGCGVSKQITNDPFVGEGYGVSELESGKNDAREIAFITACADIMRKSGVSISENVKRSYSNSDTGKGKLKETSLYNSSIAANAKATITDIVIVDEKTYQKRGKWVSEMTVKVSAINVE